MNVFVNNKIIVLTMKRMLNRSIFVSIVSLSFYLCLYFNIQEGAGYKAFYFYLVCNEILFKINKISSLLLTIESITLQLHKFTFRCKVYFILCPIKISVKENIFYFILCGCKIFFKIHKIDIPVISYG